MPWRSVAFFTLCIGRLYSQDCAPVTQSDIAKLEAYASYHYAVPGGVSAITGAMRRFPSDSCTVRVPLRAKAPGIPFNIVVFLSPERRYFGTDLMDLSRDPQHTDGLARRETMQQLNEGELPKLGDVNAPVTVVVFSDFQCVYCKELHTMITDMVLPKVGNSAVIRFRNLPLPSHKFARDAALVSWCMARIGDIQFRQFADAVFRRQQNIFSAEQPVHELEAIANGVSGLSQAAVEDCRKSKESEAAVASDQEIATLNGVFATPTIFVDDTRIDGLPQPDELISAIRTAARSRNK
jgi:protein-disulfide isomerase